MFREAAEAPQVVRRQREMNASALAALGARLRTTPPRAVVTLARGSSDHAATFARYLIETRAGVLTSSASPSIGSVYEATPDLSGSVALAISQSGRSPDLLASARQASARGALVVAMVNDESSPLASAADVTLPLHAGAERSVAASKSFIASLAATIDLLAAWTQDRALDHTLARLPEVLEQAWSDDWSSALPILEPASQMYVVGRGYGLAIAQEAALKLKETSSLHAEAFSAAEVRHGPMALLKSGFPVLLLGQGDESLESVTDVASDLARGGAEILSAGVPNAPGIVLPVATSDPLLAPLAEIMSFYRLANRLAVSRGRNPDHPPHLSKVTETL